MDDIQRLAWHLVTWVKQRLYLLGLVDLGYDKSGRPVVSLASLREPGTFDPATMAGAAYAGVALFSVLPGPVPAQQAFEELLAVGRSFAGRLGGNLQDERGAPLSMQRVAQLREEMTGLDRDWAGRSGH